MKYRSDIDGMRCLAVVSVILFHLNEKIVPGGFTGVDIFFVLSGFLITGIIVDGLRHDNFSMSRFYARRVRRIFPALFTVLLFSSLLAIVSFEPEAYKRFFEELPYSVLQASNFLFVQQVGYFDAENITSPLLHTWSLGVEEQFYLIWPLLLMVVYRFWKKRLAATLFVLAVVSFAYSQYLCLVSPKVAFYMLHSRAWELALGGLLVVADIPVIKSRSLNNVLAMTGLGLVGAGFSFIDSSTLFPGAYALLPVLGTVLMLYSGQSGDSVLFNILSCRVFVAIGALSYSLYLWHWPLIVFVKTVTASEITLVSGCGIGFASLALACLSFYVVERPLRYGALPKWPVAVLGKVNAFRQPSLQILSRFSFFVLLPLLLSYLFIVSVALEKNRVVTTISMDVELLASAKKPSSEYIALYWPEGKAAFSGENSVKLSFNSENKVSGNTYQFTFKIPDLSTLNSIRIDPLTGKGAVKITQIVVSGGFFKVKQQLDLEKLYTDISWPSPDVKSIRFQDGIVVTSRGGDPYFSLVSPPPSNKFDYILLVGCFVVFLLLFSLYAHLLKRQKTNRATLTAGLMIIVLTLLFALRLHYSNYSTWRFGNGKNTEFLLAATAMTEMEQFSHSMHHDVVLLGDSHAGYYAFPVQKWSEKQGYSFGVFAQPACPPLLYHGIGKEGKRGLQAMYQSCTKKNNQRIDDILQDSQTKIVFISIRQGFYFANPAMFLSKKGKKMLTESETAADILKKSFIDTIRTLQKNGKKVVILGQAPRLKEPPKKCLSRNVTLLSLPYKESDSCDLNETFSAARLRPGRIFFQQLADSLESVYYFNPGKYIHSLFGENETILYYDENHLSHEGSLYLYPFFEHDLMDFGLSQ